MNESIVVTATFQLFQEPSITEHMERVLRTVLIVELASTVQVKAMRYGQMTVPGDFTAFVELTILLLTMVSLELFVRQGESL